MLYTEEFDFQDCSGFVQIRVPNPNYAWNEVTYSLDFKYVADIQDLAIILRIDLLG